MIHSCSYTKCKSRKPGAHEVVLKVWPENMPKHPAYVGHVHTRIILCDACAKAIELPSLLNDKTWSNICMAYTSRGAPAPDRKTVEIVFRRPQSKEAREIQ